jgi:hypothetical protein
MSSDEIDHENRIANQRSTAFVAWASERLQPRPAKLAGADDPKNGS